MYSSHYVLDMVPNSLQISYIRSSQEYCEVDTIIRVILQIETGPERLSHSPMSHSTDLNLVSPAVELVCYTTS